MTNRTNTLKTKPKVRSKLSVTFFEDGSEPEVSLQGDVFPMDIQLTIGYIRRHYFGEYLLNRSKEEETLLPEKIKEINKERAVKEARLIREQKLQESEQEVSQKKVVETDDLQKWQVEFDNMNEERSRYNKPALVWAIFVETKRKDKVEEIKL